jgi:glutaredoxin
MTLTLYTTPFCFYCERVKEDLDRRALPYQEVTVPGLLSRREEVYRLSGQRLVPVLVDDSTVVHGSTRILEHLARKPA